MALKKRQLKNVKRVLEIYAERFERVYTDKFLENYYPEFINGITTTTYIKQNEYGITMKLADYWKWIENGRGPGKFPPVDRMISWVERKIPSPTPIQTASGTRIPTPNQLAFLVGRKISREGVEGKHYLSETIEELSESFLNDIKEAIAEDIRDYLLQFLNLINE